MFVSVAGVTLALQLWRDVRLQESLVRKGVYIQTEPILSQGLGEALGLRRLRMVRSGIAGDATLADLKDSMHLQELDLSGSPFLGDAGAPSLGRLTSLEKLHLRDTAISDVTLLHIAKLQQLEALDLSGTRVTDSGIAYLERLPRLRILDLSRTNVTSRGLQTLSNIRSLRVLWLVATPAGYEAGKNIGLFGHLDSLVVSGIGPSPQPIDLQAKQWPLSTYGLQEDLTALH